MAHSPVSLNDLRKLEQTVGWTEADTRILYDHREIFKYHVGEMVDVWRTVIGTQLHLAEWFARLDGKPDEEYKLMVRKRFVQWISDVCCRPHDQIWLNYQEEIGLRHTPEKKHQTDASYTPALVPLRYLIAFIPLITAGLRRFFTAEEVNEVDWSNLEEAWTKSVHLHVALWTRPYTKDDWW